MISRSIKGVCSELIAVKEFLKRGYYVARSMDPQCPFDIVVVDKKGKATYLMLSPYLIVRLKVIIVNQEIQLIVLYRKGKNRWALRYITLKEVRNFIIGMIILSYIVRVFI